MRALTSDRQPATSNEPEDRPRRCLRCGGPLLSWCNGVPRLPDGTTLKPELQANALFWTKTPELVKEYLRALGIDIAIGVLDQATSEANGMQGRFTSGGLFGLHPGPLTKPGFVPGKKVGV